MALTVPSAKIVRDLGLLRGLGAVAVGCCGLLFGEKKTKRTKGTKKTFWGFGRLRCFPCVEIFLIGANDILRT